MNTKWSDLGATKWSNRPATKWSEIGFWFNFAKNTTVSFVNSTKNSISPTNLAKNSTSWVNKDK